MVILLWLDRGDWVFRFALQKVARHEGGQPTGAGSAARKDGDGGKTYGAHRSLQTTGTLGPALHERWRLVGARSPARGHRDVKQPEIYAELTAVLVPVA